MSGTFLTRAVLLDMVKDEVRDHLSRVVRVYKDETDAVDEDERPDHATRHRGADGLSRLHGLEAPRAAEGGDLSRPVNVAIVLTGSPEPRAALSTHGIRLHLSSGDGEGA